MWWKQIYADETQILLKYKHMFLFPIIKWVSSMYMLFFKSLKNDLFLCVCVFCLHVCLSATCMPGTSRGQKSTSDWFFLLFLYFISFPFVKYTNIWKKSPAKLPERVFLHGSFPSDSVFPLEEYIQILCLLRNKNN